MNNFPFDAVEQKLQYKFKDRQLLYNAFVHSSYANEENIPDNERMEFFGDAVLENICSEYLYHKYPKKTAGQLSQARAFVVSAQGLKKAVKKLDILKYLLMAHSAQKVRKQSKKIEANLFEAVLCAIYLDSGYESAKKFAINLLQEYMDEVDEHCVVDYKTTLQEYAQRCRKEIKYIELSRSGPDNKPSFCYALYLDGLKFAVGTGANIKQAQISAAKQACQKLQIQQ